jgi:chromate transport protein ChrA
MDTQPRKSMQLILPQLKRRFYAPCKSVTFYAHLFVGVIIFGGLGVYIATWRSHGAIEDVSAALLGYFPAIVGAALLEFDSENQPYLRSFGFCALGFFSIMAALIVITECGLQLSLALLGTALGILFWWVANGLNPRFDDVKPQDAIGGDASGNLAQSPDTGWLQ